MRRARVLGLVLFLAGCASGPHPLDCMTGLVAWPNCPVGSKGYLYYQQSLAAQDRQAVADDARCASYGFQKGTPEFGQCRMQLDRDRQQARAAAAAAYLGAGGGQVRTTPMQPYQLPAPK